MIELGLIETATETIDKETIMIRKALVIEPANLHIEFVPSSAAPCLDDFNYISTVERKRYPAYISIESKEIYLFFNVKCLNGNSFILRFGRSLQISGWVNNNFIYCANTDNQKDIKLMQFNKGNNFFFLKLKCIDGLELPIDFTLRVDLCETLKQFSEWELFKDYFEDSVINKIVLMKNETPDGSVTRFCLVPLDYSDTMKNTNYDIEISNGNDILLNACVKIHETITYDHRDKQNNDNTFLQVNLKYTVGFTVYSLNDIIKIGDGFAKLIEHRNKWLKKICANEQEFDLQLAGYINHYKYIPELIDDMDYKKFLYNEMIESCHCSFSVENSGYIEWIKAKGGLYPISFYLKLDNSIYTYSILLPANYDDLHQYPLMIVFPYFDERPDLLATMFRKAYNDPMIEDFISILINPLGQTMGSYMGDTAIIDCIDHVKKNFSIDNNRTYGMGYSIGSYTTLIIAQNYPDLFAALFVCSGEYITETIENIRHIPMVYVSSDLDQNLAKQKYDELIKYDGFYNVISYNTRHDYHRSLSLYFTHISKKTILFLLSQKRTQPNQLTLKTRRMKYNKAYGVEILKSENYKEPSSVSYEIIDKQFIIKTNNVSKFRLKISEELKNKISSINMLNDDVPYSEKENLDFVFEIDGSKNIKYRCYDPEKDNTLAIQHINIGILYVYMDEMEIIYSQNENDIIALVRKFQNPVLFMQNDPRISVSYPERFTLTLRNTLNQKKNLVIIQYGDQAELMEELKSYFILDFDVRGCSFDGEYHEGEYSILKLYPHPFNAENRILLIYANKINQFKKNIYLRRVSIPSYTYGLHPLNEDSIICFNNKYYSDSKPLGR